jgi:hypothetical protein
MFAQGVKWVKKKAPWRNNREEVKRVANEKSLPGKGRLYCLINGLIGYNRKLHKIPAQIAEPITPEALQAMASINK